MPPIAVVTHTADFEHDAKLFTRTEVPPLILTCTRRPSTTPARRLGGLAEVIDASGPLTDRVDPAAVMLDPDRARAAARAHRGRPPLLSLFIEHDLIDELCLTIAPILVGGPARRIAAGSGEAHTRMRRSHLLTDDEGYLYSRYVRADEARARSRSSTRALARGA